MFRKRFWGGSTLNSDIESNPHLLTCSEDIHREDVNEASLLHE